MRVLEFAVSRTVKHVVHMSTEGVCSPDMINNDCTIPESGQLGDIHQVPQLSSCTFQNGKFLLHLYLIEHPFCQPLTDLSHS